MNHRHVRIPITLFTKKVLLRCRNYRRRRFVAGILIGVRSVVSLIFPVENISAASVKVRGASAASALFILVRARGEASDAGGGGGGRGCTDRAHSRHTALCTAVRIVRIRTINPLN